jgi:hypothetical protein
MRPNRNWLWFFAALVVLGVIVIVVLGVAKYSVWQQRLTIKQLEAAQELWESKKVKDYDLVYTKRLGADGEPERFEVQVRGGKTRQVLLGGKRLAARLNDHYGMDGLFGDLWTNLKRDEDEKRPALHRGAFDPEDGHLLRYERRESGQPTVEIVVQKVEPAAP